MTNISEHQNGAVLPFGKDSELNGNAAAIHPPGLILFAGAHLGAPASGDEIQIQEPRLRNSFSRLDSSSTVFTACQKDEGSAVDASGK